MHLIEYATNVVFMQYLTWMFPLFFEQTIEETFALPVVVDTMTSIWCHCNEKLHYHWLKGSCEFHIALGIQASYLSGT